MSWEGVSCDLCGRNNFSLYLDEVTTWEHPGKFKLVKCQNCGLVFVNPRPTKEEIKKYYPPEKYWGGQDIRKLTPLLLDKKWKRQRDKRFGSLYREVFKQFSKPAKILDIGCGAGGFLTAFGDRGWQVLGTEISQEAASFSQKAYGFPVKLGDFQDVDLAEEKFDVVTLNSVLEHLYSPRKTLERINRVLEERGLLIITVPNINSLGSKIFGAGWYAFQPPRHLYHFSPKTVRFLLEKTGFRILSTNHFNWNHNFYSLFESFRFKFSPRFKKAPAGGLTDSLAKPPSNFLKLLTREVGKALGFVFASTVALIGAILKRGEVFTVYAEKA